MCTFMLITYINYNLFCFLENNNSLDVKSDVNMFVLQFFFRARVIVHLDLFAKSWDCHKISSAKKSQFCIQQEPANSQQGLQRENVEEPKCWEPKLQIALPSFFQLANYLLLQILVKNTKHFPYLV